MILWFARTKLRAMFAVAECASFRTGRAVMEAAIASILAVAVVLKIEALGPFIRWFPPRHRLCFLSFISRFSFNSQ
jgi:hypothetical protein